MQSEFRARVFTPIVLPLTALGGVLLFAWSFAQILLVVPEVAAAFLAVLLALYILVMASLVATKRTISSRVLTVSLAVGMVAVVVSGAVANAAGMRELHAEEEVAEGGEGEAPPEGEGGATEGAAEIPPDAGVFVGVDIAYDSAPETLPAGGATIALDNQGAIEHNVVFESLGTEPVVEAQGGQAAVGEVNLEAGEQVYYCSIPGHRAAGMEGTLTVE
jgi:plastocyanin